MDKVILAAVLAACGLKKQAADNTLTDLVGLFAGMLKTASLNDPLKRDTYVQDKSGNLSYSDTYKGEDLLADRLTHANRLLGTTPQDMKRLTEQERNAWGAARNQYYKMPSAGGGTDNLFIADPYANYITGAPSNVKRMMSNWLPPGTDLYNSNTPANRARAAASERYIRDMKETALRSSQNLEAERMEKEYGMRRNAAGGWERDPSKNEYVIQDKNWDPKTKQFSKPATKVLYADPNQTVDTRAGYRDRDVSYRRGGRVDSVSLNTGERTVRNG